MEPGEKILPIELLLMFLIQSYHPLQLCGCILITMVIILLHIDLQVTTTMSILRDKFLSQTYGCYQIQI